MPVEILQAVIIMDFILIHKGSGMADKQSSGGIIWGATAVIAVALVTVAFIGKSSTPVGEDEVETRIQPVARVELAKAEAPVSAGPKDGATIYNTVCGACHNTGVAGAPKLDDKAAWAPRVATGNDALYKSVLGGKGAMPAKGGATDLSDDEIKGAVDYILGKVK